MSKRKHDGQMSEEEEEKENGAAKRGRPAEAHDVGEAGAAAAAAVAAAAETAAEAAAADSAAVAASPAAVVPLDPFAAEVAFIRRTHLRHVHTETLMLRMRLTGGQAALRLRVGAYVKEMKRDAERDESLLDVNYQDEDGRTLLMHIIELFGDLCTQPRHPSAVGSVPIPLTALDAGGVKDHLERLLRGADLTLRDGSGLDSLNFLAHNIVVNDQCYTDWFVVTQLVSLAAAQGLLDARDPAGCTAFLHWCGSGPTPNVLQLLIAHGCDVEAVDRDGNTGLHRLTRSGNFRALEALAKDEPAGFLCRPTCFMRNRKGQTPLDLSESRLQSHHAAADSSRRVQVHRLLQCAWQDWERSIQPLLQRELQRVMQLADLAQMALEYLDGSGRPFDPPPAKSPTTPSAAAADARHSPAPAPGHAAAQPVAALDAEMEEAVVNAPAAAGAAAAAPAAAPAGPGPAAAAVAAGAHAVGPAANPAAAVDGDFDEDVADVDDPDDGSDVGEGWGDEEEEDVDGLGIDPFDSDSDGGDLD